ncbi:MAG TPA: zinc ribbon domain-containing protein [Candidatus Dormibacteraeota bacterium]|nr:zinc ribbon domain-containing protein [Candidatus Dormibacteraeota bacterium]
MSDAVGSIASLPAIQMGVQLIAAYVVILWLGAAFWAYRDMRRRTHDLLAPFASAALVVAFTPILFPAAFLIHLVLRPPETLEERSEHDLRRSILESEAVGTSCPTCLAPVADAWLLCPSCGTRLRRRCPQCEGLVELTWDICAWCGRDFVPAPVQLEEPLTERLASATDGRRTRFPASLPRRQAAPTRSGGPHVRRRTAIAPVGPSFAASAAPMRSPSDG